MELTTFPVIDITNLQPNGSQELAHGIIEAVVSGSVNAMDLPVKKKLIEQALEVAIKNPDVMDCIQEEIKKHGKFASHMGAKIEVIEAGTKYHYENCQDPELSRLIDAVEAATDALKSRQKFLQTLPVEGLEILQGDEVIRIFPPYKTSTTSIKTTIK